VPACHGRPQKFTQKSILIGILCDFLLFEYSHLSNNRGGWNERRGGAKVAKSIIVEVGINVEGGIFWKKLVHKCNKRGVEGGKNLINQ
jgi:hypothetical protein